MIPPLLFLSTTNSELPLTYTAEGPTSTNSKHISRDPYSLLLCDVTAHPQADGLAGNTCHVTAAYYWCVTSPILCQLSDTRKTQLVLLLWAHIVFTELLPGNELIKYATLRTIIFAHRSSMFRHLAGILANPEQLLRDFSQFLQTISTSLPSKMSRQQPWKSWSSRHSSWSFHLRTCDQVEVSCLVFHKTRVKISVSTPTILTRDFLCFPQFLGEMLENTSKQHNQFLSPAKSARGETLPTCIQKIFGSNLGRDTYYHYCFRGYPQSIQGNVRIVP
jgi:hypothetical protein